MCAVKRAARKINRRSVCPKVRGKVSEGKVRTKNGQVRGKRVIKARVCGVCRWAGARGEGAGSNVVVKCKEGQAKWGKGSAWWLPRRSGRQAVKAGAQAKNGRKVLSR